MEPECKRMKLKDVIGGFQMFSLLPTCIIEKILGYVRISDIKNVALVNREFYEIISKIMKNRTYLYIHHHKTKDLDALLNTRRRFNEIFFYGKQLPTDVSNILKTFGENISVLKFAKNDLKFMKVPRCEFSDWLKYAPSITELDLTSIEIEQWSNVIVPRITLKKLKKLKCYDEFLNLLHGPGLEKLELHIIDMLTNVKIGNINKFVVHHYRITEFSLRVFCSDNVEVQDVPINLSHLKLKKLIFCEFRYNPRDIIRILKEQKDLIKLQLEDGMITNEDVDHIRNLAPMFDEILQMNKLNKLVIEMPTISFLSKLQYLPNLKRLSITNIPQSDLKLLHNIQFRNLEKLCIENIEYGKKALEKNNIACIKNLLSNLHTLKIDTTPLFVMKVLLSEFKELKVLKMIRNTEVAKKCKQMIGENVPLPITNLEKIICDSDDFKLRILPIVKVSPNLTHMKIYWNNKNTSFVSMAFDIIKVCPKIKIIELVYEGTFVKEDILPPDESHFIFSRNNMHFEAIVLRKEAKITYRRI